MAISKVVLNGTTLMDATTATATAEDIIAPKTALIATGVMTEGTGSGGVPVSAPEKAVNFIDYDGTILYSYTSSEVAALTSLPSNPTHSGLISQGWNWTLAQIRDQLNAVPKGQIWIGQMYATVSGATEIDIDLINSAFLSPCLVVTLNGTATVDWGDNSAIDTITGTDETVILQQTHTYASTGLYTIKITGPVAFYSGEQPTATSYSTILVENYNGNLKFTSTAYSQTITAVRLAANVNLDKTRFTNLINCKTITVPNKSIQMLNMMFKNCQHLVSLTIPTGTLSIADCGLWYCDCMATLSLPYGLTDIGSIHYAYSLKSITLPLTVTTLGAISRVFGYGFGAYYMYFPPNISSLGSTYAMYQIRAFEIDLSLTSITSIHNGDMSYAESLKCVYLPSTVTSIDSKAFAYDRSLEAIYFYSYSPPSLANQDAFTEIPDFCKIYVPQGRADTYKSATNWSVYASHIEEFIAT